MPEACSQLDYHRFPVSDHFMGNNLGSMNLFCDCDPGACFVQLDLTPSFGDLARHAVAVHVMKPWTKLTLPSEMVAIVTGNSSIIGNVHKIYIEEEVAQE